jgi:hypothetical protein
MATLNGKTTDDLLREVNPALITLRDELRRFMALLDNPQPGLSTWHGWLVTRLNALEAALDLVRPDTGPGSGEDRRKALLRMEQVFSLYPGATGYSHIMGLIIRDVLAHKNQTGEN